MSHYSSDQRLFSAGEGTIDVWLVDLSDGVFFSNDRRSLLSAAEIERADRFVFEKDRERFVRCRTALRRILAAYMGSQPGDLILSLNRYGKPFINAGRIRFNVSHSREVALIAVTMGREIGVDIEFVDPHFDVSTVAGSVFSNAEVEWLKMLRAAERSKHFYVAWTRKEAALKAIGEGFSASPEQQLAVSEIGISGNVSFRAKANDKLADWSLSSLVAPRNYVAALSVEGKIGIVRYRETASLYDEVGAVLAV